MSEQDSRALNLGEKTTGGVQKDMDRQRCDPVQNQRRMTFSADCNNTKPTDVEHNEQGNVPPSVNQKRDENQNHLKWRRSSVAQLATARRERKWSVGISSIIATIPALLVGITLGFPSNVILDLSGEATELPQDFFISTRLLSAFVVGS